MGRRPSQTGKDYTGCVWALISFFNIHHGQPTQKLLSDRKHENSRQDGNGYSRTELDLIKSFQHGAKLDGPDGGQSQNFNSGMSSVKTLIEEEMSKEHYWNNVTIKTSEHTISDTEFKSRRNKKHKLTNKKLKGSLDACTKELIVPVNSDNPMSNYAITSEKPGLSFDLAAVLLEYYGQGHQWQQLFVDGNTNSKDDVYTSLITIYGKMHEHLDVPKSLLDKKWPMLVKALADLSQEIKSQNVSGDKLLSALRAVGPTEFLNALDTEQIKEAVLKLLHDPLYHKQILDVRNSQVQKPGISETNGYSKNVQLLREAESSASQCSNSDSQETQRRRGYSFFAKKEKWNVSKPSKTTLNSVDSDAIVVLEPNLRKIQNSSTITSPCSPPQLHVKLKRKDDGQTIFSYKEIKQRIKSIFRGGKKEHVISMNGALHTLAIECHDLVDRNKQTVCQMSEMNLVRTLADDAVTSSETVHMREKTGPEKCQVIMERDVAWPSPSNVLNEEIREHIAEMQDTEEKTESLPQDQALVSTERTTIVQDETNELVLSPKCIGSFNSHKFSQEDDTDHLGSSRRNLTVSSLTGNSSSYEVDSQDLETELCASHATEVPCTIDDFNNEGTAESIAVMDNQFATSLPQHSNEIYTEGMKQDNSETIAVPGLAPSSVIVEGVMTPERTIEKPGKGSPVSVLDKFEFSEDMMSPDHTSITHSSTLTEPRQLHFEEHANFSDVAKISIEEEEISTTFCIKQARLMYVETVLEASGLVQDDLSDKWNMESQLIEPSLFDELGPSCYPLDEDRKFLFDYINEILIDIQERISRSKSSVYSKKLHVEFPSAGVNLVHEVSKIVDWNLSSELPETIEQMIQIDFYCKTWMDLEPEIEEIVSEVSDIMVDDLMKETTSELWSSNVKPV